MQTLRRLWNRLELSVAQTVAYVAGFVALLVSLVAFGGVTEDVTRHDGMTTTDPLHLRWFIDHRSARVDTVARVLSAFGNPQVLGLVAIVSAVALWLLGTKVVLAISPGIALAIAATGVAIGKAIVARGRPPVALHLVNESDASFPSGHATDTTAILLTLALVTAVFVLRRPLLRVIPVVAAVLLSCAVGVSRLILGVHWPTDVLSGWALGATVALAVTLVVSVAVRVVPRDPEPATKYGRLLRVAHLMNRERRSQPLQAT
jgi:membrane-associated phospholipid phosphatase